MTSPEELWQAWFRSAFDFRVQHVATMVVGIEAEGSGAIDSRRFTA